MDPALWVMRVVRAFQELVWIMLLDRDRFALTLMNVTKIMEVAWQILFVLTRKL